MNINRLFRKYGVLFVLIVSLLSGAGSGYAYAMHQVDSTLNEAVATLQKANANLELAQLALETAEREHLVVLHQALKIAGATPPASGSSCLHAVESTVKALAESPIRLTPEQATALWEAFTLNQCSGEPKPKTNNFQNTI